MLTEFAIKLCDGNAVLVSQDVDYWVDTSGSSARWAPTWHPKFPQNPSGARLRSFAIIARVVGVLSVPRRAIAPCSRQDAPTGVQGRW